MVAPTLAVSIMHVPDEGLRTDWVRAMLPRLRGAYGGPRIVPDPGRAGPWPTARRAWLTGVALGASHVLVTQDDMLPCRDFVAGLQAAIRARPYDVILPYSSRAIVEQAAAAGLSWARMPWSAWGAATLMPRDLVLEFLAWERKNISPSYSASHDDVRVCIWMKETGRDSWVTVPSLIEHLGASDSLLGHNNRLRTAKLFIGAEASALSIDWSRGAGDDEPPRGDAGGGGGCGLTKDHEREWRVEPR